MTPRELERLISRGTERPYQPISPEQRALLPRVDIPPKPESEIVPAKHLDARYLEALEHNQKLSGCCRRPEESGHTARFFSTPSADKTPETQTTIPDVLIIWCGECGRKHVRLMIGSGTRKIVKEVR